MSRDQDEAQERFTCSSGPPRGSLGYGAVFYRASLKGECDIESGSNASRGLWW